MRLSCSETPIVIIVLLTTFLILSVAGNADAAKSCYSPPAQVVSVRGNVNLRPANQTVWQPAAIDEALCPDDMMRVRVRSRATLRLINESMLSLDQNTIITVPDVGAEQDGALLLDLFSGNIHITSRTPRPFKLRTRFGDATIVGTEFLASADEDSTQFVIFEGQVSVSNEQGSLVLADNEAAIAREDERPQKIAVINPVDAVQWALYYPIIIDTYSLREKFSAEAVRPELQASIDFYQAGKFFDALTKLEEVAPDARTVPFLNFYASLLLTTGRVDEAQTAIKQALQLNPDSSDAYALKAIIAVALNDKRQALNLANRAAELDQMSATAKLALSYAQQAHFEIEQALASVQEAVKIDTQNALAWARVAELQMSVGHLDLALESARQAVNLNPALAKTQTVLGFAHLLQIDIHAAKTNFSRAIALDQIDPMPRLGMGLALIREGKLEAGRIELEIAVSLDPVNSLIRSYLGKAYFEEKRYPLASTQFGLAKALDPNDPTPWLYDAIQKQTQNRPVEALQDIQKSIELNDNRAVYRSRLLLDRDEAGRGSSLARIYDNLGFEKRALMETAKSLSYDPASHSAHRFLSDAYINIPKHEIARVSELLQAQLLQPINVNPVQPHLAVADLNIITNTGPAVTGFNEFAPLVERNHPQLVASGIAGSNNTFGDELVASVLYDRASISIGQFHYETDGFRPNNDETHNIYNAFFQYAVTPKFNIQAELRSRKTEHGDLLLDFDRKEFDPDTRRKLKEDMARIGARYAMSPNQDLLVSAKYIDRLENNNLNNAGFQLEAQHLFRKKYFNSIIGGSIYNFSWNRKKSECDPLFDENKCIPLFNDIKRENFYIYTNINFPSKLINATLGLSYDAFTSSIDGTRTNKLNPKFGLQWDIFDSLRLRFAWFETTKSHLLAQQTLEPTQVAGFNQFFDDTNGTRSRRVGIGLDSQISKNLYSGIEVSERELLVPTFPFIEEQEHLQAQKEQLIRAYLYWSPHIYWAIHGALQFEKFMRNANDNSILSKRPTRIQTLSAPLSIEYFHPSGFFSKLTTTFVEQDLTRKQDVDPETQKRNPAVTNSGVDDFFLLDSVFGYRLPKRRGILNLEGRNLLNKKFYYRNINFYQSESISPLFIPERTFFARLTLNF
jgi:tetratricopeptide (TPR) repeat protein